MSSSICKNNSKINLKEFFEDDLIKKELGLLNLEEENLLLEFSKDIIKPSIRNPSEIKEGNVCLFYDLLSQSILSTNDVKIISDQISISPANLSGTILAKDKQIQKIFQNILEFLKSPTPVEYKKLGRYGGGTTGSNGYSIHVDDYIRWFFLTDLKVVGKDVGNFNNSISSAVKIYNTFKKIGSESFSDLGSIYTQIRNNAVSMVGEMTGGSLPSDKWSPADIFIYRNKNVRDEVVKIDNPAEYNSGKNSFISNFDTKKPNIIAVSLKEADARQGRASSFSEVLNQNDHYSQRTSVLDDNDSKLLRFLTSIRLIESQLSKGPVEETRFWNQSKRRSIASGLSGGFVFKGKKRSYSQKDFKGDFDEKLFREFAKDVKTSTSKIFNKYVKILEAEKKEFLNKTLKKFNIKFIFKRNSSQTEEISEEEIGPSPQEKRLNEAIIDFSEATNIPMKEAGKIVLTELSKKVGKFDKTQCPKKGFYTTEDVRNGCMSIEIMMKKINCYHTANYMFNNFQKVGVKDVFKNLSQSQNPFAALTAYAVGMAGFSPTFFKVTGSPRGLNAHIDIVYGSGILEFSEKNDRINIDDSIAAGEVRIRFLIDAFQSSESKEKVVKVYSTRVTFQSNGRQVKIEVEEFKEKK